MSHHRTNPESEENAAMTRDNKRAVFAARSAHLDTATCLALRPIHDIGNQAIKERDEWNRWAVGIASMLNVSCSDFASDAVADQYAELRGRITQALNH